MENSLRSSELGAILDEPPSSTPPWLHSDYLPAQNSFSASHLINVSNPLALLDDDELQIAMNDELVLGRLLMRSTEFRDATGEYLCV